MRRIFLFAAAVALVACSPDSRKDATAVEPDGRAGGGDAYSSSSSSGVHPRWVLVDADGEAVEAVVSMNEEGYRRYPNWDQVEPGTNFDPMSLPNKAFTDVGIAAIGGRKAPQGTSLRLESGEVIGDELKEPYFTNENCEGTRYDVEPAAEVYGYDPPILWPKGEVKKVSGDQLFQKDYSRECEKAGYDEPKKLVPLKPIPNWLKNAFSNPPYELRPAY